MNTNATRQKPLYNNCFLQAPDGELLCTCDKRKAMWYDNSNFNFLIQKYRILNLIRNNFISFNGRYVDKSIGELIKEDPLTVRLKFEPAGRAVGETGKYYQTAKENHCVVCANTDNYSRKNIVPREYRKNFPCEYCDYKSYVSGFCFLVFHSIYFKFFLFIYFSCYERPYITRCFITLFKMSSTQ